MTTCDDIENGPDGQGDHSFSTRHKHRNTALQGGTDPPCYLPQPGDELPMKDHLEPMGPIGPWATGKVDWSPVSGLTGTRPISDHYTITRFSPSEWRSRNLDIVNKVNDMLNKANEGGQASTATMNRINSLIERTQAHTTESIKERVQLIGKWKKTLEDEIAAMADEITTMEEQRLRLKQSLVVFGVPESIAKECIDKRCGRADNELIRDPAEEELVKELALISEVRRVLQNTLEEFDKQQIDNRTSRERLEYDWSNKSVAYDIDIVNAALNNHSKTIMFRAGAMRQPPEQASGKYWEHFSSETLQECEKTRQQSIALRQTLNSILMNATRDIRTQADIVDKALTDGINCTILSIQRFEHDLKDCLQKLADTENRIVALRRFLSSFDAAMKVAQTRMDNRSFRPNVESCRDKAQQELIDEVATLQSSINAMLAELDEADNLKNDLMHTRTILEREIMLKRRSLWIDRDRCMKLRSHYPSANALSGHVSF